MHRTKLALIEALQRCIAPTIIIHRSDSILLDYYPACTIRRYVIPSTTHTCDRMAGRDRALPRAREHHHTGSAHHALGG
jgi:hypothetical protein